MKYLAVSPSASQLKAIRNGTLIHLSRMRYFNDIVKTCTGRPGVERVACDIHLKPTKGIFKNLSVFESAREKVRSETAYIYWFLGEPGRKQRGWNTSNAALIPREGWTPPPDEISFAVPGAVVLESCGGRLFFRAFDQCVATFGEYRGPAMVGAIPIR